MRYIVQEDTSVEDNYQSEQNITYKIEYRPATFSRRVMANLVDILVFAVFFVSLLLGTRAIVNSTSDYKSACKTIDDSKIESCLYEVSKNDGQIKTIIAFYYSSNNYNPSAQYEIFNAHISGGTCLDQYFNTVEVEGYLPYIKRIGNIQNYNDLVTDYNKFCLSSTFVDSNKNPYFIQSGNSVIRNINCQATDLDYVKNVYVPYIENTLVNTLVTCVPGYYNATKFIANMVSFVEIPIPYVISGLITYIVPIFIFKRGRKTWGKALYGIGLISTKDFLCPSKKRTAARFSIFYFGELILSLLTFGIPFILSFTMMAFTKMKQGFPDYMLGLVEIDTHDFKIFFNKEEITLEDVNVHKKPVNFNRPGL